MFDPYATGVAQDWPAHVERLLHQKGRMAESLSVNVRIINAGVPGHRTLDSIGRLLSEIHYFKPDYVILCHAWNDIKYFNQVSAEHPLLHLSPTLSAPTHQPVSWLRNKLEHSQIILRLESLFRNRRFTLVKRVEVGSEGRLSTKPLADSVATEGVHQYRLALQTFVDITRNMGAQPILFTQPRLVSPANTEAEQARIHYAYVHLTHKSLVRAFALCDQTVKAVAQDKKVPFFDYAEALTNHPEYFDDHVHFKDAPASAMAAQPVATFLDSLIAIGTSNLK